MKTRYAKMYVMDVRPGDKIKKRSDSPVGTIVKKTWVEAGRFQIIISNGPEEFMWTSNDTAIVWIEVP